MNYNHLNIKDRENIYRLKNKNFSINEIASDLSRSKSTIYRELKRNKDIVLGYLPDRADLLAKKRKFVYKDKIINNPYLIKHIIEKLNEGLSPEMIAGRAKLVGDLHFQVSHETIYKFIYSDDGIKMGLYNFLIRRKGRRGQLYGRKASKINIPNRVSIHDRPAFINEKKEYGHFEGDLTFCKEDQSCNLAVMTEKKSKFSLIVKNESKKSNLVMKNIFNKMAEIPNKLFKSITFDNGGEFSKHGLLSGFMTVDTYFCDPGSPWQKGLVEHTNMMLHRFIDKKASLKLLSDLDISIVQNKLNNLPRKSLIFKTPAEVFNEQFVALRI